MASGQQLSEINFRTFTLWLGSRTDDDFKQIVVRGSLSRKEIASQCSFALSVVNQNPRIKTALRDKELHLRERGILPPIAVQTTGASAGTLPMREQSSSSKSLDAQRLGRLELENASLRAENSQLKRELDRYAVIRDVLATTGRFPR